MLTPTEPAMPALPELPPADTASEVSATDGLPMLDSIDEGRVSVGTGAAVCVAFTFTAPVPSAVAPAPEALGSPMLAVVFEPPLPRPMTLIATAAPTAVP